MIRALVLQAQHDGAETKHQAGRIQLFAGPLDNVDRDAS
jgi:hypothetical protein